MANRDLTPAQLDILRRMTDKAQLRYNYPTQAWILSGERVDTKDARYLLDHNLATFAEPARDRDGLNAFYVLTDKGRLAAATHSC